MKCVYSFFDKKGNIILISLRKLMLGYSLERSIETFSMSTSNISFCVEIRKKVKWTGLVSRALVILSHWKLIMKSFIQYTISKS